MPRKRLSMRKIREILRLKHYCNCSIREISKSCGIGRGTVGDYLHRATAAGLSWLSFAIIRTFGDYWQICMHLQSWTHDENA